MAKRRLVKVYMLPELYAALEDRTGAMGEKVSSLGSRIMVRYLTDPDVADHVDRAGPYRHGSPAATSDPCHGSPAATFTHIHRSIGPLIRNSVDPPVHESIPPNPPGGGEDQPAPGPRKPKRKPGELTKAQLADFRAWYRVYPRHNAVGDARKAWLPALARSTGLEALMDGAGRYADLCARKGTEAKFVKLPATWLRADCWEDEADPVFSGPSRRVGNPAQSKAERDAHRQAAEDAETAEPDPEFEAMAAAALGRIGRRVPQAAGAAQANGKGLA